jgi:peroxiredoxin
MTPAQSPGEPIPVFRLPASTGHTLELDSFKDKVPLVLLFLQPGNSRSNELLAVVDRRLKDFGAERSQILVVMRLTARETRALADERGLAVPVLADASGSMARDFEATDEAERPVAVVADKSGRLVRRFDPLSDADDPEEIVDALLYAIRAIGSGALTPEDRDPGTP